jgi:hypothetical protein
LVFSVFDWSASLPMGMRLRILATDGDSIGSAEGFLEGLFFGGGLGFFGVSLITTYRTFDEYGKRIRRRARCADVAALYDHARNRRVRDEAIATSSTGDRVLWLGFVICFVPCGDFAR